MLKFFILAGWCIAFSLPIAFTTPKDKAYIVLGSTVCCFAATYLLGGFDFLIK